MTKGRCVGERPADGSQDAACVHRSAPQHRIWSCKGCAGKGDEERKRTLTLAFWQTGSGMQDVREADARGLQPPKQNCILDVRTRLRLGTLVGRRTHVGLAAETEFTCEARSSVSTAGLVGMGADSTHCSMERTRRTARWRYCRIRVSSGSARSREQESGVPCLLSGNGGERGEEREDEGSGELEGHDG